MQKILIVFSIILFSFNSFSQSLDPKDNTFFLTEDLPQCEGGMEKINLIFNQKYSSDDNNIKKLRLLVILINYEGKVSIVESKPKINSNIIDSLEYLLNSIEWVPAYQRQQPTNFQTILKVANSKNSFIITNKIPNELKERVPYDQIPKCLIESLKPTIKIEGLILDIDTKQTIPFASVYIDGKSSNKFRSKYTSSDKNGRFTLNVNEDYIGASVKFTHICYAPLTFSLTNSENIIIPLQKVIVDFESIDVKNNSPEKLPFNTNCDFKDWVLKNNYPYQKNQHTSFEGGYECFSNFIAKNFTYPEEAYKEKYDGEIIITLEINELGRPVNLQITGDYNFGVKEAINALIVKMPIWRPAFQLGENVSEKVEFKIVFGNNQYWTKKYK